MPLTDITALLAEVDSHLAQCRAQLEGSKPVSSPSQANEASLRDSVRTLEGMRAILVANRADIDRLAAKSRETLAYLRAVALPKSPHHVPADV